MSPWFPYLDCTAATPALCLCSLRQGYGDHKPKSSTAAQEVKTLDGIFTEQVAMGYAHSLVIARDESETEKEKIKKLPEYNPRTL